MICFARGLRSRPMWSLAICCASMLSEATGAQTRMEAGYSHIVAGNSFHSADWGSVDTGRGGRFAFNHDHGRLRLGLATQLLNLEHRNSRQTSACDAITLVCRPIELHYAFTDKYRSYDASADWAWNLHPNVDIRVGGSLVHERWSNDDGTFNYGSSNLPTSLQESRSTKQTTWAALVALDMAISDRWRLSTGIAYQHKSYRAVVRETVRPRGPKPLFETHIRLGRRLGDHFDAFVEWRPSKQRHYATLGVGYRF